MEVQRLDARDLDLVRPAWSALVEHLARLGGPMGPVREPGASWRRRRSDYVKWLADPVSAVFAAREAGEILGYATVRHDGPWGVRRAPGGTAELETLSVVPSARGRGIGATLCEHVRRHLSGHGVEYLIAGVLTSNTEALRFWAREGFKSYSSIWWKTPDPVASDERPDGRVTTVEDADVDSLAGLYADLSDRHRAVGPAYLPTLLPASEGWAFVRNEHVGEHKVLLRVGDEGYVLGTLHPEGADVWDSGPLGHTDNLVVRDNGRGRGTGAVLLAAVERGLQELGATSLELEVLEGNDDAMRFYARHGYERVFESLLAPV